MNRYRVIVLREGKTEDETLFELSGSAVLVGRLAPGALLDVLSTDPETQGEPAQAAVDIAAPGLADRVFDAAVAAGADAEQAQQDAADDAAGKPKRTRRTKEQIANDKAAQGLGFRDHAHRVEVEAQQQVAPGVQVTTAFAGAVPVPAEVPSGPVPPVSSAPPAGASSAPRVPPWNPFTQD
jgi:hypothetical protein